MSYGTSVNYFIDLLNEVQGAAQLAVAGVTTVYGKSFALPRGAAFGLQLKFSGTAIQVKVDLEESNQDLTAAEEGSAHAQLGLGKEVAAAITDGNTVVLAVTPIAAKFARLKLTGSGSNNADCKLIAAKFAVVKNA